MIGVILVGALFSFVMAVLAAKIHGIILSFQKKWYTGVVALIVPGFAVVVSVAKVVFKKDLLQ